MKSSHPAAQNEDISEANGWTCSGERLEFIEVLASAAVSLRAVLYDVCHGLARYETPYTWAEKFENFERIKFDSETNGNFDSCNSCKRLGTSRLRELNESKFPFVSRIEFIRSHLSNFSAHVYGVDVCHGPETRRVAPGLGEARRVSWPRIHMSN